MVVRRLPRQQEQTRQTGKLVEKTLIKLNVEVEKERTLRQRPADCIYVACTCTCAHTQARFVCSVQNYGIHNVRPQELPEIVLLSF